jgi:integrase
MQEHPSPLRERVERGIYKRKTRDGSVRYELAFLDETGRQRWRTCSRLQDARDLRAKLVTRVAEGEHIASSKITLEEYAEAWLARQTKLRTTTHALYASHLRQHVLPRLGRRRLQSITPDDVVALIGEMEKGIHFVERDGVLVRIEGEPYRPWTIRGVITVLGRVMGAAVRSRAISSNPVRLLTKGERPTVERRDFPRLDRGDVARLIMNTPSRYRTLVAVSVLTGIRQGEALGLRWQDVDVREGVLRVRSQLSRGGVLVEPKTRAAKRDIPIPPSLAKMLAAHKAWAFERGHAKPSDYVFASETGRPLAYQNIVRRGLQKALEGRAFHLRWHDLRHVAASTLIAQGADVAYLSRVLGHSSPAITLGIYAHAFAERDHADVTREKMEAAFGSLLACD